MRIILLFLVLFITKCGFSQGQPWVGNNAVWLFHSEWSGFFEAGYRIHKTGNVIRGSHLCDELLTYQYDLTVNPLDSVIIDTNYTCLSVSGDSVMYEQDGVFRVLYDFSKPAGDSTLYHVNSVAPPFNNCNDSSYASIYSNEIVNIVGVNYRAQQIGPATNYNAYNLMWMVNERFGPMDYGGFLFPTKNNYCWGSEYNLDFAFHCFSDDNLVYDLDCDFLSTLGFGKNDLSNLSVFPNPFTRNIHLSGVNENGAFIHLSDNLGTILFKGTSKELEDFNTENLRAGSYWLRINLEDGHSVTKQLVKL